MKKGEPKIDTTIKYKGKEIPKAGRLTPRPPYNF